jgi:phosphatidylglycerol:prolipoprotein diacylglycerol transferase
MLSLFTFPFYISLGDQKLLLHTITEFAGMFIGFRYYIYLRKKEGDTISTHNRLMILIGAIFGALVGSRLVGGLEDIAQLKMAENSWLYFFNNKSIVGGLLGGLFGVELIKYAIGEKQKSGDLFVFPLLLAMVIGRLGCFSMGIYEQTFGIETTSIFGINLGDGVMRHPVMLYEIGYLILWGMLGFWVNKKMILEKGQRFQLFMISYLLFRFFIEFLKPNKIYFLHLGTIQIACVFGCIYYGLYFALKKKA